MKNTLLVIAGAVIGGALGNYIFFRLIERGLYGMIIPGGLLGIGAGLARSRSLALAVTCGVAALILGLFTEWQYRPFRADGSFTYFLRHILDRDAYTLGMIAVGGFIGFWGPYRRRERAQKDGAK
jgi:hypothetical protein